MEIEKFLRADSIDPAKFSQIPETAFFLPQLDDTVCSSADDTRLISIGKEKKGFSFSGSGSSEREISWPLIRKKAFVILPSPLPQRYLTVGS